MELAPEKRVLFDKWCHASKVNTLDDLRELILLEEFKAVSQRKLQLI